MNEPPSGTSSGTLLGRFTDWLGSAPESRAQLLRLLQRSHQRELIDAEALSMIEGVMQVAELSARDTMVPRAQMDIIDIGLALPEMLDLMIKTAHSRFPVIEGERDNVIGILHAKDMLRASRDPDFDLRDLLRPSVFIPESKRLNVLLRDFRVNRNHIAIVVDEYGGVSGLITIEDVLEQIVGDIEDEFDFDEESDHIVSIDDGANGARYRVRAIADIEQFNTMLGTHFATDDFDTIGGLVTDQFGRVPHRGESVVLEGVRFEVLRTDERSLQLMLAERVPPEPSPEAGDETG